MGKFRQDIVIPHFDSTKMYCPCCLGELTVDGDFEFEDCVGQINYSTKYICKNLGYLDKKTGVFKQCMINLTKGFFCDYGSYFTGDYYYEWRRRTNNLGEIPFVFGNNCHAAFNSFAKQSEVEIYKAGLTPKMYLSPALCLFLLRPMIEFEYKGDKLGNILSRSWNIKFLKKDKLFKRGSYCIHYISGVSMFLYRLKKLKRLKKRYEMCPRDVRLDAIAIEFKELMESTNLFKSWDRIAFSWYVKIFHHRMKRNFTKCLEKLKIINNFV